MNNNPPASTCRRNRCNPDQPLKKFVTLVIFNKKASIPQSHALFA
jgi:hypothetical protein